ncbi:MAG: aminopeptidase P family protein [Calditrichia bacterium]|nr:aminopeptidase P family protein [Calditrichia bacterium]
MAKTKLKNLRKLMKKHKIQAYLVPSTDPHQSEYVPATWNRREWFSGFTGSAGDVVITQKRGGLWTDSRYFLQAEEQLKGSEIQLFKMGTPGTPSIQEWIATQLKAGDTVGIDPRLISQQQANQLKIFFQTWKIKFKGLEINLVDKIWKDQPAFPETPLKQHPLKYAGKSYKQKIDSLRTEMQKEKCTAHILTTLDTIAWLFNIRGKDIPFNPLVISYAIITLKEAYLFIPSDKIDRAAKNHLKPSIKIYDYNQFVKFLKKQFGKKDKIWLDPTTISWWITNHLKGKSELFLEESPISHMKAVKNSIEIKGLKNAHIRDGVAMVKFLKWLEQTVGLEKVTELSASQKLENIRKEQNLFQGPSFNTISAYQAHGAIVHYAATPESDVTLRRQGIYLIDSGGQFLDGTTDITRTLALGKPNSEQKDRFTRVLKGHIRLAMTRFPKNTAGNQLDTLARKSLWDIGLNYGHGTGHGIGSYLNVHEGPHAISYYRGLGVALEPGMIVSNEPGYYKAGAYGIRIENLILVTEDEKKTPDGLEFNKFETVSLCPIQLKLIAKNLLSSDEIKWLNDYHQRVRKTILPLLNAEEQEWLKEATRPL